MPSQLCSCSGRSTSNALYLLYSGWTSGFLFFVLISQKDAIIQTRRIQPIPDMMRVTNSAVSIFFFIFKSPSKIFECGCCILASGTGYSAITRIRAIYVWCAVAYIFKPFPVYIYQLEIIHFSIRNSFFKFSIQMCGLCA